MSDSHIFLIFGLVFTGALVWGLKSGMMPTKGDPIDRDEFPKIYWSAAVLLFVFAMGSFAAAIGQGK